MRIYVETLIRADLATVRRHTLEPALHARWDARFTRIDDLTADGGPRRFRYTTRLLPGLTVAGLGVTSAGPASSALRFACADRRSLVAHGRGYWRYVPTAAGVRFLTGYDYEPRWGRPGRVADRLFRPVLGWATAWSFDRLRLWLERGVPPWAGLAAALAEVALRGTALLTLKDPFLVPLLALVVPPSPWTPAARRCLRRPPDRTARTEPGVLSTLEQP